MAESRIDNIMKDFLYTMSQKTGLDPFGIFDIVFDSDVSVLRKYLCFAVLPDIFPSIGFGLGGTGLRSRIMRTPYTYNRTAGATTFSQGRCIGFMPRAGNGTKSQHGFVDIGDSSSGSAVFSDVRTLTSSATVSRVVASNFECMFKTPKGGALNSFFIIVGKYFTSADSLSTVSANNWNTLSKCERYRVFSGDGDNTVRIRFVYFPSSKEDFEFNETKTVNRLKPVFQILVEASGDTVNGVTDHCAFTYDHVVYFEGLEVSSGASNIFSWSNPSGHLISPVNFDENVAGFCQKFEIIDMMRGQEAVCADVVNSVKMVGSRSSDIDTMSYYDVFLN